MTVSLSVSWDDSKKKRGVVALLVGLLLIAPLPRSTRAHVSTPSMATVIVESLPGALDGARHAVIELGGSVGRDLRIIGGFVASVPVDEVDALRNARGVHGVSMDGSVRLHSTNDDHSDDHSDPTDDAGSMSRAARAIGARSLWTQGITGDGVDVALIDSGVVPVDGLTAPGKVVNGPDLSFESQNPALRYVDTFGHGTHMAGIIAGRDDSFAPDADYRDMNNFSGVAPDARLVNVKVADAVGAADVSQVIAAIDWVVQHRHDNGLNIRVVNLSFGTDGDQGYLLDPLVRAVDVAWEAGIVVVVAAGNRGHAGRLDNPGRDPRIIAVAADDSRGTSTTRDDVVPQWSSSGDGVRNPDVIAPGRSIVSLRDAGSYIDQTSPGGRVGTRFFRGSGTSASTAMVSGAAALLLQGRPDLTPDQVKTLLMSTARSLSGEPEREQGAGLVSVRDAVAAPTPAVNDSSVPMTLGSGSLEAARGSSHVGRDGQVLAGEQDVFGAAWVGGRWAHDSSTESSWSGGVWNGNTWTGDGWWADSWAGPAWGSAEWSESSWSGTAWSGNSWSGHSWTGNSWSGNSWSGNSWSGNSWSGNSWSGNSWSGNSWSGNSWSFLEDER